MSLLKKYAAGWSFRTNTPAFEVGEELSVFVTGVEGGDPVARIGDTTLRVTDGSTELVDSRVRLRVTAFDDDAHTGEATYLETVGESAF